MKQLDAKLALVHEIYSLLAVHLRALPVQWGNASMKRFGRDVDCLFDVVDEQKPPLHRLIYLGNIMVL